MTVEDAAASLPEHLAAKARNPLQATLATILTTQDKEHDK